MMNFIITITLTNKVIRMMSSTFCIICISLCVLLVTLGKQSKTNVSVLRIPVYFFL